MSMNPESRKRAVEVIATAFGIVQGRDTIYSGPEHWTLEAEAALDALLADGFHVAEWRKVEDAESGKSYLLSIPGVNRGLWGCEVAEQWGSDSDDPCWWTNGGPNAGEDLPDLNEATAIMDLPSPPKDGEA